MTKSQIKAELRRSACEDLLPYVQCANDAFYSAADYCVLGESTIDLKNGSIRTFFLLVAEAL